MRGDDQAYWDGQAGTFDDEPDHGLADARVREAWRRLLVEHLPAPPVDVLDIGMGTGSLSVLLAECGHVVRGVDFSGAMVSAAAEKAARAGVSSTFQQADAAEPPFAPASCDVVLCRHVLWALPDPSAALRRWCELLRPDGRLLLIEGRWSTGSGLLAADCRRLVLEHRSSADVRPLGDAALWGRPINDERYLLVSTE